MTREQLEKQNEFLSELLIGIQQIKDGKSRPFK